MRDTHNVQPASQRMVFALAAILTATIALSGCGALTGFLGDEEDELAPAELESFEPAASIRTLWSRRVASGEGNQQLDLRAVLAGGRLFAAGHDGDVGAYDPSTGERLWETDTGQPLSGGPGAGNGLVVVGDSAGGVVALSSTDGAVAWRARLTSEVLSAPAVGERIVAVRTVDGKLWGLDAASGAQVWVYDRTVPALSLRGTSAPVIADEAVVAGFDSGHLAAISLDDGQLLWEFQVAVPTGQTELERLADMDADPVVSDGTVYAAAFQGRVAAFELRTGRPRWQRDLSSYAGIGIGQRLIYVTDEESHVWAFDRGTGASLWRQDGLARRGVTRPVEFGGHVVVADSEGYIHWLDIDDGRFAARTRAGGGAVTAPPVTGGNALYVLGGSGTLTSFARP
ncbi:MAG: outer membrane protein assembly factor BamB [Thiotrichales bacterium]|nr:outer membrane protein assembly factor BamB [Thiotrichales bacterium]